MIIRRLIRIIVVLLCFSASATLAEDIELYRTNHTGSGNRPQVLLVFDSSGSMGSTFTLTRDYEPLTDYSGGSSFNQKIYYSKAGQNAPGNSSNKKVDARVNSCASSYEALYGRWKMLDGSQVVGPLSGSQQANVDTSHGENGLISGGQGYYTGVFMRFRVNKKYTSAWQDLTPDGNLVSGNNIEVLDCMADVDNLNQANNSYYDNDANIYNLPAGLPVSPNKNYCGNSCNSNEISAALESTDYYKTQANGWSPDQLDFNGNENITIYADNYVYFKNSDGSTYNSTRLAVAKEAAINLISTTPGVDFGLMTFTGEHGGRVVKHIKPNDDAYRTELINIINAFEHKTSTPLAETLWEAKLYFGGEAVYWGGYHHSYPPYRDTNAISGSNYNSPFANAGQCNNQAYVILLTDGQPWDDYDANSFIEGLPGANTSLKTAPGSNNSGESRLPVLSDWLFNNDINNNIDGEQTLRTYTIGFGDDAVAGAGAMLEKTAVEGGGLYFPATDAEQLKQAFNVAIASILQESSSFNSPSVSVNSFDRTRSLDKIYFSQFLPELGPRWSGNIKRLKVVNGTVVDSNNVDAINSNGVIKDSAKTFWGGTDQCSGGQSGCADGNEVTKGGVFEYLQSESNRKVYSDLASSGSALTAFTVSAANSFTYPGNLSLADFLGVDASEADNYIKWHIGIDAFDEDEDGSHSDIRFDVFGDPLHSRPFVMNYGNDDIRFVVGTNAGALHMFKDDETSVSESWAFYPHEFFNQIATLVENDTGSDKVYGIDSSPVVHVNDVNDNGIIESNAGDSVWLFTGLRRGGNSYYALDITNPDSPQLMWKITNSSSFPTLGDTWSRPVITYIQHNLHDDAKPVLIFGAGYYEDDDDGSTSIGRGIYIVDAQTGQKIWGTYPSGDAASAQMLPFNEFSASIHTRIAVLDSDSNGYVDRLYAADRDANIWRIDMPSDNPVDNDNPWTVFKFAQLADLLDVRAVREIFADPIVFRSISSEYEEVTIHGESESIMVERQIPFDGIVVGTGKRHEPNSKDTDDFVVMLKDENVLTRTFKNEDVPSAITPNQLFDVTSDPFLVNTASQRKIQLLNLSQKKGWVHQLQGEGEKSLTAASVVAGVVYFTSFTPSVEVENAGCEVAVGGGRLYAVGLHFGNRIYQNKYFETGSSIPDTPVVFGGENNDGKSQLYLIGVGAGENESGTVKLVSGTALPATCEGADCPADPCYGGACSTSDLGLKTFRHYTFFEEED